MNRSLSKGIIIGTAVGTMISAGTALAATNYIKAIQGSAQIQINGKSIATASKLVASGNTYIKVQSIQQVMNAAGFTTTWKGNALNVVLPRPVPPKSGGGSGTGGTTSTPGPNVVGISQLPYTAKFGDGMTVKINSINATSDSTVFNVTVSNNGSEKGADVYLGMLQSSLSDGGSAKKLETDADSDFSSPNNAAYNSLQPGQSVDDVLTYDALSSGTAQFTWYFNDFGLSTQSITFDLNK